MPARTNAIRRPEESPFGADPWLNTKKLRDEREAHQTLIRGRRRVLQG